jgi:YbbR domain-containing protein
MSQTVRVPPSVVNIGTGVQLVSQPPPVAVTISGPAPALANLALNPNDFRVLLDVGGKGAGKYDVDARVQSVPAGLNLEGVAPTRVPVELREAPPPPTPSLAPAAPPPGG